MYAAIGAITYSPSALAMFCNSPGPVELGGHTHEILVRTVVFLLVFQVLLLQAVCIVVMRRPGY
jgi:hypothetical protein